MSSGATITSPRLTPIRKLDAPALRQSGIARQQDLLHCQCAANCIDDAAELDESPVAGILDDPAAMLADFRLDDLAPTGYEAPMGAFLVGGHQPRISDDIGSENRRQPALETRLFCCPQAPERLGSLRRQPLHED